MTNTLEAFITQRSSPEPTQNILYLNGSVVFQTSDKLKDIDARLSTDDTLFKSLHEVDLSGVGIMDEAGLGALLYLSNAYAPTGSATRWSGIRKEIEPLLIASGMLAPISTLPPDNALHHTQSSLYDGLSSAPHSDISDGEYDEL